MLTGAEAGWNAAAAARMQMQLSHPPRFTGNCKRSAKRFQLTHLAAFERAASADEVAHWEASGFNAAQIGFAIVNGAQNDDLSTVTKKVDYAEAFVSSPLTRQVRV